MRAMKNSTPRRRSLFPDVIHNSAAIQPPIQHETKPEVVGGAFLVDTLFDHDKKSSFLTGPTMKSSRDLGVLI